MIADYVLREFFPALCTILSGDIFFTWVRYTQEMWRKQERSGRIWSDIVLGSFSKQ